MDDKNKKYIEDKKEEEERGETRDKKEIYEKELKEDGVEIISCDDDETSKNIFKKIADGVRRFKKKKYGAIIWQLGTSLLMLAIAAGIGIFLAVGKTKGGPVPFGEKYFGYFANRNWYNMYNDTDIEESKFINRTTFSKVMNEYALEGNITDYEVEVEDRDSEYAIINVKYTMEKEAEETTSGETTVEEETAAEPVSEGETPTEAETETEKVEGTYKMTLKKQEEKILLFYTTWKGFADAYIIEDCKIEVPSYVTPTFDGIDLSDCYAGENSETGNVIYELDRVFVGTHTIRLTGENIDAREVEVVWEEDNSGYAANAADFGLKAEYKTGIEEQAVNIVVGYYSAVLAGQGADGIKSLLVANEEVYSRVDQQYSAMEGEINHSDGRTLINMEISSYSSTIENYQYMSSLTLVFNYTANYNARTGRTVIDGVRKRYEGTNSAVAKVYFQYIDGTWKAVDAEVPCIDYTVANEG